MKLPRWQVALGVLAAVTLAFLLRDMVQVILVEPLAYFFWRLGVIYRIIPQQVYWIFLIIGLFYVALNSFYSQKNRIETQQPVKRGAGPVETLSYWVERGQRGIYFRWQVARMLAQVALSIAELRENRHMKTFEWPEHEISTQVKRYLDAGLNSSFADYPLEGGVPLLKLGQKQPSTPFDIEIVQVVDYLETEMENRHDK